MGLCELKSPSIGIKGVQKSDILCYQTAYLTDNCCLLLVLLSSSGMRPYQWMSRRWENTRWSLTTWRWGTGLSKCSKATATNLCESLCLHNRLDFTCFLPSSLLFWSETLQAWSAFILSRHSSITIASITTKTPFHFTTLDVFLTVVRLQKKWSQPDWIGYVQP